MKIRELIDQLQRIDGNLEVQVEVTVDWDCIEYHNIKHLIYLKGDCVALDSGYFLKESDNFVYEES